MRIKGFNENLQCRGFQFEIGKEYKIDLNGRKMKLCTDTVFHYCDSLEKVHEFYDCLNDKNRFCEIEVLGEEITDGEKCGSNHIKIIREITGDELDRLKGYINGNVGLFNSGSYNNGNLNSGHYNSGNCNSGNYNTGNRNSGDSNSGDCNSGNCNSGCKNNGDCNSGDCNSGDWNSGDSNSGDWNSGDCNSGNWNSGDSNSGDYNSGNYNSGYKNSGDWNSCNYSNGVFCNKEDKNIRIFNKPSGMSLAEFRDSKYYRALTSAPFILTKWMEYSDEERVGGYLKQYSYKEACQNWWNSLTDENKKIIQEIPNFDKEVFFDITGIDVSVD